MSYMLCVLYSKYSNVCRQLLDIYSSKASLLPYIKFVCIDNVSMRSYLNSSTLNVKSVPCVLLFHEDNKVEKFEHSNISQWLINHMSDSISVPSTSLEHLGLQTPQTMQTPEQYQPPQIPQQYTPTPVQPSPQLPQLPQQQIQPQITPPLATQIAPPLATQIAPPLATQIAPPLATQQVTPIDLPLQPDVTNITNIMDIASQMEQTREIPITPSNKNKNARDLANEIELSRKREDEQLFPHTTKFQQGFNSR
jgi:hypothetical protein